MTQFKQSVTAIAVCAGEVLAGIFLFFAPEGFTRCLLLFLGIAAMLRGVCNAFRYFFWEPEDAAHDRLLAKGILQFLAGIFLCVLPDRLPTLFPGLAVFYGTALLFAGALRCQWAADAMRLHKPKYGFALISAGITMLLGLFLLWNPFPAAGLAATSISLLLSALVGCLPIFLCRDPRPPFIPITVDA